MDKKLRLIKDLSRYPQYFRLELLFWEIKHTNSKNDLYSCSIAKSFKSNLRNRASWMASKENIRYEASSTRTYFVVWICSKCFNWLKSWRVEIYWKDIKKTWRHGDLKQRRTKDHSTEKADKESIFNDKKLFFMVKFSKIIVEITQKVKYQSCFTQQLWCSEPSVT